MLFGIELFINTWKVFEMWCWRRMEKTSWTDHVRNEEISNCEVREKTNKMQQLDVYYQYFLNMFRASLCPSSGEQRPCVTACGVLRWFCWMWLVAVVEQ